MDVKHTAHRMIDAWNSNDPAERRRLIEATCTEETEVLSPYGEHRGIAAQLDDIAKIRAQFPEAHCTDRVLAEHHGWVLDLWSTDLGDGSAPLQGIDVSQFDTDGRLIRVVSFSPVQI